MNITVKEYVRRKALGLLGLIDSSIDPRVREERLTFVNDINEVLKDKLKEYNVWYAGDADELLNFYTRANMIDYNTDPLYNRNKKSYFWAVSSTESDIKRTHSGQPRNIVDTLVDIIGLPSIFIGDDKLEKIDKRLKDILEENNFDRLLLQKARPLTFVEGWGAWKINWDTSLSDNPVLLYYRADAVDFIFRNDKQLVAIIYKDYYQDEKGRNYVLFETRRIEKKEVKDDVTGIKSTVPCLLIEKELFQITGQSEVLKKMELKDLPQLKDTKESIIVTNFNSFLGAPSIIYEDNHDDVYGRSIFTGKIDLFDDLDQCYSQAANTVRRSTSIEYFNTQYLEKNDEGMPVMPHAFDRKYIAYKGGRTGDGTFDNNGPVQVVQPRLDFTSYSVEEQNILINILSGIMSPATLGIDVAKKDNAAAQREKEKVTIFTRNTVIYEETKIFKRLANDLLVAWELMHTGQVTCKKYDISVQYEEFADASFENKLETVLAGWQAGIMSDETALKYLHGDRLSEEMFKKELEWVQAQREKSEGGGMMDNLLGSNPEDQGAYGVLGADNEYNEDNTDVEIGR